MKAVTTREQEIKIVKPKIDKNRILAISIITPSYIDCMGIVIEL